MGLQQELSLPNPFRHSAHEALLNVAFTGTLLAKEGDRVLRPLGLTDSQMNVLMLLKYQAGEDGLNQTALGRMLLVNRSNVTGLVDRMEQAGLVRRVDDPQDRRVKYVRLTGAGSRVLGKAAQVYYARIEEIMGTLTPAEHRSLCRLLERVRERLNNRRQT